MHYEGMKIVRADALGPALVIGLVATAFRFPDNMLLLIVVVAYFVTATGYILTIAFAAKPEKISNNPTNLQKYHEFTVFHGSNREFFSLARDKSPDESYADDQ